MRYSLGMLPIALLAIATLIAAAPAPGEPSTPGCTLGSLWDHEQLNDSERAAALAALAADADPVTDVLPIVLEHDSRFLARLAGSRRQLRTEDVAAWTKLRSEADALSRLLYTQPYQYVVDYRDPAHRIEVDPYEDLDYREAFGVSLWLYAEGDARASETKILSHAGVSDGKLTLMLRRMQIECFLQLGGGRSARWISPTPIPTGQWVHLATSYDQERGLRVFVDGTPFVMNQESGTDENPPVQSLPDQTLYVGCLDRCFPGRLDDLRLYGRALEDGEIRALSRGEGPSEGLIGHWPLDEEEGNLAQNTIVGGSDGRIGAAIRRGLPGTPAIPDSRSMNFSGKHQDWTARLRTLDDRIDTELHAAFHDASASTAFDMQSWDRQMNELLRDAGARLLVYETDLPGGRALAFVIEATDGDEPSTLAIPLGSSIDIVDAVHALTETCARPTRRGVNATAAYRDAARRVATLLFDPVAARLAALGRPLRDGEELWLRRDPALRKVPFAALVDAEGQFLVERFATADLGPLSRLDVAQTRSLTRLVAFGDPAFGIRSDQQLENPWLEAQVAQASEIRAGAPSCLRMSTWLFGSHMELEALDEVYSRHERADDIVVFRWDRAYESAFREHASSAGILHLATHGYRLDPDCLPESPKSPLEMVGMELSGSGSLRNDGTQDDDGYLSAGELARLDLQACELVVFSGCETARGTLTAVGNEWGLPEGAYLAGAKASLATRWELQDATARLQVADFYDARLAGQSVAVALGIAQRNAIERQRRERGHAHPYYWAPFAVVEMRP